MIPQELSVALTQCLVLSITNDFFVHYTHRDSATSLFPPAHTTNLWSTVALWDSKGLPEQVPAQVVMNAGVGALQDFHLEHG